MRRLFLPSVLVAVVQGAALLVPGGLGAQTPPAPQKPAGSTSVQSPPAGQGSKSATTTQGSQGTQTAPNAAAKPAFKQEELDQLVAPIALYPDSLISQVLM